MKFKSKKGSSLISLLVIMGALIIVSISVLSLTVGDYSLRVRESNRVKNLYKAESGLDETFGILGKMVDSAISSGNEAVKNKLDTLDNPQLSDQKLYEIQNSEFKAVYKTKLIEELKKLLVDNSGYILIKSQETGPKVLPEELSEDIKFNAEDKLLLRVISTFISEDSTGNAIEREIAARFVIGTPDYNNPFSKETTKIKLPIRNIWSKALYTDKNLIAKGDSTITGDIYVRGDSLNEEKGIIMEGTASSIDLSGNVITSGDTTVKGISNTFKIKNGNLYTGSLSVDSMAQGANLTIDGVVYANNDLVLNGSSSNINIKKGYYGFNDVNESNTDVEKAKNSSAIIINSPDIGEGSSITIMEEAMLMGTAYIRTKDIYQTGESVAIKGNYRAYTKTFSKEEIKDKDDLKYSDDKVQLEYNEPLQLVTKFIDGTALVLDNKSRYFMLYSQITGNESSMKLKGVTLPENTISAGSIITNGMVKAGNYIPSGIAEEKGKKHDKQIKSIEDFSKEIDLSSNSGLDIQKVFEDYKEVIYVDNQGRDLVLTRDNLGSSSGERIIVKNKDGKGVGKGIIITSGDVTIEDNVDFTGTIIAGGNIIISGKNIKLNHDSAYVKLKLAEYNSYFSKIFIGSYSDSRAIEIVTAVSGEDLESSLQNTYVTSDSWRIIK